MTWFAMPRKTRPYPSRLGIKRQWLGYIRNSESGEERLVTQPVSERLVALQTAETVAARWNARAPS